MRTKFLLQFAGLVLLVFMAGCRKDDPIPDPIVISTDPLNLDASVRLNNSVSATFNVPMDPKSFTAETFTLYQGTKRIEGSVVFESSKAIFLPKENLAPGRHFTATIHSGVTNASGDKKLVYDHTWEIGRASCRERV